MMMSDESLSAVPDEYINLIKMFTIVMNKVWLKYRWNVNAPWVHTTVLGAILYNDETDIGLKFRLR